MENINITGQEELQTLETTKYLRRMLKNCSDNSKIIFDFSIYYPSVFSDLELTNLMFDTCKPVETRIIEAEILQRQHLNDRWINVVLMRLCFSIRNENSIYYQKSTEYARLAVICGHNEGEAEKRLVINLTREKRYNQIVELCSALLDDKKIKCLLSKKYVGYFEKKLKINEKRLVKSIDTPYCRLFSKDEYKRWMDAIEAENIDVNISEEDRINALLQRSLSSKNDDYIHIM
ncbi:MAG: hypothetical protein MJ003_05100 [Paludibacteraceae bacterium]|nr:hypothetical protein [Paludibacteraceae bacterium]